MIIVIKSINHYEETAHYRALRVTPACNCLYILEGEQFGIVEGLTASEFKRRWPGVEFDKTGRASWHEFYGYQQ